MSKQLRSRPIRVTHVITALPRAGAEMVLFRLLAHGDRNRFEPRVVTLMEGGELREPIKDLGVPVATLGMSRGRASLMDLWRLRRLLGQDQPDVVQTWMYHSDLLGGLAALSAGLRAIIWSVHHTDLRPGAVSRRTRLIARTNALLSSRIPRAIVCCADSTKEIHLNAGFDRDKLTVIHNGTSLPDVDRVEARVRLRNELGLPAETALIGRIGRFHAQKDHATLFRALSLLASRHPQFHVVLCGSGIDRRNAELVGFVDSADLGARTHLLGVRTDIERITAALDVSVSSSAFGEAHPMIIGEAMAAGVPVVTTDVGDSAALVGDTGWVVPPEEPTALADAVDEVLSRSAQERRKLGARARERIRTRFSIDRMVDEYERLYEEVISLTS